MPKDFILGGTLHADLKFNTALDTSSDVVDVRGIKNILRDMNIISGAEDWYQVGVDLNGQGTERFGSSVSLSQDGTVMAVGAPESTNGTTRIYKYFGTTWVQLGEDINGQTSGDDAGFYVSLSADGTRVAIGEPFGDGGASGSGVVSIWGWDGSAWVAVGDNILDGVAASDRFGYNLSLSKDGTTVAVGAYAHDAVTSNEGEVRVFRYNVGTTSWDQIGGDINGDAEEDWCGRSVNLSADGNRMVVGFPQSGRPNDPVGQIGYVRVYEYDSGTNAWNQLGSDIDGDSQYNGWFGFSSSISADGTIVALSAVRNNGDTGMVRVYNWNGSAWVQRGDDLVGDALLDFFGYSVNLSADGTILAVGATQGLNNDAKGYARVFEWNGAQWTQVGTDQTGDVADDEYGEAVSLSANGQRLSVGARYYDSRAGLVRVFDLK